jgi:serine/threonine protein kinase
MNKQIEQFELI